MYTIPDVNSRHWYQNVVDVLDPATATRKKITVGYLPHDIAINATTNRIYIVDEQSPELVVVDGATRNVIARAPINGNNLASPGSSNRHIAASAALNRVYLARIADDSSACYVDVIDGTTYATLQTLAIDTGTPGSCSALQFVAVDDAHHRLYIGGAATFVSVYNIDNNSLVTTVAVPSSVGIAGGMAVNPVSRRVYIGGGSGFGGSNVAIIDGSTN